MKVAVITLKDSPNYGGILQAYALQKAIEKLGIDCSLIDYMNDDFRQKFTFWGKPKRMPLLYWLFKKVQYPLMVVMMRRMLPFYDNLNVTEHFFKPKHLHVLNSEYDCFITGSDQVWACDLNYFDDSYFLSFVDDRHKKISYAASFGRTIDMITEDEKQFIAPLLMSFNSISVREDSGVDVVRLLTGRSDAIPVLDPTFLLDKDDWEKVASHNHKGKNKKYILCYLMQTYKNDQEALRFAKRLSSETGLPIIKICRGLTSVLWGETIYVPTVEEWIGLFLDAECVITNSFHGMAFSVNFCKDFYVFLEGSPSSGRNSRIYDRCADLDLLDRIHIVGSKDYPKVSMINYERTKPILEKLKKESIQWLENKLADIQT